jgi:hypothetical protein
MENSLNKKKGQAAQLGRLRGPARAAQLPPQQPPPLFFCFLPDGWTPHVIPDLKPGDHLQHVTVPKRNPPISAESLSPCPSLLPLFILDDLLCLSPFETLKIMPQVSQNFSPNSSMPSPSKIRINLKPEYLSSPGPYFTPIWFPLMYLPSSPVFPIHRTTIGVVQARRSKLGSIALRSPAATARGSGSHRR